MITLIVENELKQKVCILHYSLENWLWITWLFLHIFFANNFKKYLNRENYRGGLCSAMFIC
jgi:hypothetical protein